MDRTHTRSIDYNIYRHTSRRKVHRGVILKNILSGRSNALLLSLPITLILQYFRRIYLESSPLETFRSLTRFIFRFVTFTRLSDFFLSHYGTCTARLTGTDLRVLVPGCHLQSKMFIRQSYSVRRSYSAINNLLESFCENLSSISRKCFK